MAGATVKKTERFSSLLFNLGILLALSLSFSAAPARADNAFLLQLGIFDTEDQANQRWDEVKSKDGDLLGSLNLHIAEVALDRKSVV